MTLTERLKELPCTLQLPVRFDPATRELYAAGVVVGRLAPTIPQSIADGFSRGLGRWITIGELVYRIDRLAEANARPDASPPGGEVAR